MPRKARVTVLISGSGSNLGALLAALPTSLQHCEITHVLSSKPSAYGLTRAAQHLPKPVPSSSSSLLAFRKAHPKPADTPSPDAQALPPAVDKVRELYDIDLAQRIRKTRPDLVVLAGWMLILSPAFLRDLARDWDESDAAAQPDDQGVLDVQGVKSLATPGDSFYPQSSTPSSGTAIPIINLHPALPGQFPGAHAIENAFDAFNQGKIDHTGIMIHRVIPELDAGKEIVTRRIDITQGESLEELEAKIHKVEHEAIVDAVRIVTEKLADGTWWSEA
ncbi:formyl transferase [Meredithblackwellia eburnea MCA 4105]